MEEAGLVLPKPAYAESSSLLLEVLYLYIKNFKVISNLFSGDGVAIGGCTRN